MISSYTEIVTFSTGTTNLHEIQQGNEYLLNYPNPFHSKTVIGYQVSSGSDLRISIYDLTGLTVAILVNERKVPGRYEVEWNAEGMEPGIYLCTFHAEDQFKAIKMILIK